MAAGAQLYVFDKKIQNLDTRGQQQLDIRKYQLDTIFDVCQRLNGPLPVYHPQFLQQAILTGVFHVVLFSLMCQENCILSKVCWKSSSVSYQPNTQKEKSSQSSVIRQGSAHSLTHLSLNSSRVGK